MRIVIDMQGAQTGSRFRGIGRYTISLVKAMLKNHGHHEYILVMNGLLSDTIVPLRSEFRGLIEQENIRVWEATGPIREIQDGNSWRRTTAQLIRESFIESLRPDLVLLTTLFEGYGDDFVASIGEFDSNTPVALIFYDIIPFLYPEVYLADKRIARWYQNKLEQCKRASLLLSISDSSRQEAIEHLEIQPDKIVNISAASDDRFFELDIPLVEKKQLLARFGLTKPYLMYLSATDWRKNHKRLIEAYSKLPKTIRTQHQLCLVGGLPLEHKEAFTSYAKSCGLAREELVITGYVTDEEINMLCNLCKAFVFPSWHEGFGLPVLEAMQCGRAVIGANTSSLPEIIGMPEALFDPFDVYDIKQHIERVLIDATFRKSLENHAREQVKRFSWNHSAKTAIEAIECRFQPTKSSVPLDEIADTKERTSGLIKRIAALPFSCNVDDLFLTANAIAINEYSNTSQTQLFVDISELVQHDAKTGIQRVVTNILCQWLAYPPTGVSIKPVYATTEHGYKYANSFINKFMGHTQHPDTDEFIEFRSGDVFIGLDLVHPDVAEKHQKFYQLLRKHGVIVKFVLYDLLPLQLPQYCNVGVPEGFNRWLSVVFNCDGMVCISKTVANDLKKHIEQNAREGNRKFDVDWFHLGADVDNSHPTKGLPPNAKAILEQLRARLSFLMVGTLEPRKGHVQVLDAFERLWESGMDINLVIVGKQGWMVEELVSRLRAHPKMNKNLFWLEGISDEYLEKVYAASTCLIAASYGEGFGLPLIEAAQHKLPIIARDIPVFREVAGEHAFYFDSKEAAGLADSINAWLERYKNTEHPRSDEMPWLTWEQSAQRLLEIVIGCTGSDDPVSQATEIEDQARELSTPV